MRRHLWTFQYSGLLVLALGFAWVPDAAGNGGPFVIKYPNGDPAAKGVLARLDPNLKPGREERLRVVKEDLKLVFAKDPFSDSRPRSPGSESASVLPEPLNVIPPPLAYVSAAYTIENPTTEPIEIEFGFPILRGVYMNPWSMMPSPDVLVKFDSEQIRPDLISNSMIYGLIRQRARAVIDKAVAADPKLATLVARVAATSYLRQRAREAVDLATGGQETLRQAALQDAQLAKLVGTPSDAADQDRVAAREELMGYLTGRLKWTKGPATLLVEYASMDLGQSKGRPMDAGFQIYGGNFGDFSSLAYANLGRLAAIGEQKTTQLFAELATQFEPRHKEAYEAIFTAWGGDVRERSVDLRTGQVRPRELTLSTNRTLEAAAWSASTDPTIYARMDYINPHGGLTAGEKASCETLIRNLPVTFTFAPMNLLHYRVKFPPNSTKTLTVSYKQYAFADTREPASYQLAYVIHPASLWRDFGPIELEVAVPTGAMFRGSVPCQEAGVEERALPKDPSGATNPNPQKFQFAIHRATLTEKTGELFLALDGKSWSKHLETVPKTATR